MNRISDSPILVISDTHFGFEDETTQRFQRFMTYLTDSVKSGRIIIKTSHERPGRTSRKEQCEESLEVPQKIILLGDLVDLWISRDSNTVRPYQESFDPLNSLIALKREIMYLVGNHDGIMEKYAGPHVLPNSIPFTVCLKGYPNKQNASNPCKGEQIGERSYFFIHGHQFDPIFRHSSMLHLGNFLGFSSAAAGGFLWFTVLGALVLLLTGIVVLSPRVTNWLPSLLTHGLPLMQITQC